MSNVIKSSQIIGEYKLNDVNKDVDKSQKEENNTSPFSSEVENDSKHKNEQEKEKVRKAREKAEEIIARSREKAAEIENDVQNQVKKELESARKQGYKEGFEKGEKEGYEKGIKDLKSGVETLKKAIKKVRTEFDKEKQKLPGKIIDLSTRIAARIINVKLDINPELINNIIKEMLADISNNHNIIKIKVIPELVDYIDTAEIKSLLGEQSVEFIGDGSLENGDCIVKTDFGGKDGTLIHKLELLEKELYKGIDANGGL